MATSTEILEFWFSPASKRLWFAKSAEFDNDIRTRFLGIHERAAAGGLAEWEATADGALALLILVDQFPRNMFRGTARAFATDGAARDIAVRAIGRGFDRAVAADRRSFFLLPLEHSESLDDQKRCVELFRAAGPAGQGLDYALQHLRIIERFGRFPHRNAILGRMSTPEEIAFLAEPGSSF